MPACGEAPESKGAQRTKRGRRRALRKLCLLGRARRLDGLAGSWAPGTRLGCLLGLGGLRFLPAAKRVWGYQPAWLSSQRHGWGEGDTR